MTLTEDLRQTGDSPAGRIPTAPPAELVRRLADARAAAQAIRPVVADIAATCAAAHALAAASFPGEREYDAPFDRFLTESGATALGRELDGLVDLLTAGAGA